MARLFTMLKTLGKPYQIYSHHNPLPGPLSIFQRGLFSRTSRGIKPDLYHRQPEEPMPNPYTPGNSFDFDYLIQGLVIRDYVEGANRLTLYELQAGLEPNERTINNVMSSLFRKSKFSFCVNLYNPIIKAGIFPRPEIRFRFIKACLECGKLDLALEHYEQLLNFFHPLYEGKGFNIVELDDLIFERALELGKKATDSPENNLDSSSGEETCRHEQSPLKASH